MNRLDINISKEYLEKCFFRDAMSAKQVAKELGCSEGTIKNRLRKYGIKLDPDVWYGGSSQYQRKLLLRGVKLTPRQQSIVVGHVLGDGTLNKGKGSRHAHLCFMQCIAHQECVKWLRQELQPFVPVSPYTGFGPSPSGKSFEHIGFCTTRHPEFTEMHNLFYPEGTKIIPENISDYLDELALAVWFMDDGHTGKNYSVVHTQSFTRLECKLLLEVLHIKFDIDGTFWQDPNGSDRPILAFLTRSGGHRKLHDIIDPLLHRDFEYKKFWTGPGHPRGEKHHASKLNGPGDVREIRRLAAIGTPRKELAERFGLGQAQISSIVLKRGWAHII